MLLTGKGGLNSGEDVYLDRRFKAKSFRRPRAWVMVLHRIWQWTDVNTAVRRRDVGDENKI